MTLSPLSQYHKSSDNGLKLAYFKLFSNFELNVGGIEGSRLGIFKKLLLSSLNIILKMFKKKIYTTALHFYDHLDH